MSLDFKSAQSTALQTTGARTLDWTTPPSTTAYLRVPAPARIEEQPGQQRQARRVPGKRRVIKQHQGLHQRLHQRGRGRREGLPRRGEQRAELAQVRGLAVEGGAQLPPRAAGGRPECL